MSQTMGKTVASYVSPGSWRLQLRCDSQVKQKISHVRVCGILNVEGVFMMSESGDCCLLKVRYECECRVLLCLWGEGGDAFNSWHG